MPDVAIGNHLAVFAGRNEQEKIRAFYAGVLGCNVRVEEEAVDRFELNGLHLCFVYQDAALDPGRFLSATYLELKTDDVAAMRRKILEFGVNKLDIPDSHLYFQAPGGQVFRLVGQDEDLSVYEESTSTNPGASAAG